MKSQADCWRHLLDGGKLISKSSSVVYSLRDGKVFNGDLNKAINLAFMYSEDYKIYTEPRWEDKVSEDNPVLCWCWKDRAKYFCRIDDYKADKVYPYIDSNNVGWKYATPCTKAEILKWAEAAPE